MTFNDQRLDAMVYDHDSLRATSDRMEQALADGDLAGALPHLRRFAAALQHHFDIEEQTVMVILAAVPELHDSVTRLRAEHDTFRLSLAEVLAAAITEHADWPAMATRLVHQLALHETEEETDLFPAAEPALPLPAP